MKHKPHNNPTQDGWPEAERCPHCNRWIVLDLELKDPRPGKEGITRKYYKELNFDKYGNFYYGSNRKHNLSKCESNKLFKEMIK